MSVLAGHLPSASDAVLADRNHQYDLYSGDSEPSNDPFFLSESQPARDYTLPVSRKQQNIKRPWSPLCLMALSVKLVLCAIELWASAGGRNRGGRGQRERGKNRRMERRKEAREGAREKKGVL